MSDKPHAYPLSWPAGFKRTEHPRQAPFGTTMVVALDGILRELRLVGAPRDSIVISSNVELRLDGRPYATKKLPNDPGVAVYFTRKGNPLCIPCDRWARVEDNMQAIRKSIEAMRGLERWGASSMVDAVFDGFAAIPAQASDTIENWWDVLGVDRDTDVNEVKAAYRRQIMKTHPDTNKDGSADAFRRVQRAYERFQDDRGKYEYRPQPRGGQGVG